MLKVAGNEAAQDPLSELVEDSSKLTYESPPSRTRFTFRLAGRVCRGFDVAVLG
jgi:hypothetical protein